jgi:hypothetical protein
MLRDGADDEMMLPHGVAARGICFAWEAGRGRGRDPHAARCRAPSRGVVEATDELTSQLLEDMENRVKIGNIISTRRCCAGNLLCVGGWAGERA